MQCDRAPDTHAAIAHVFDTLRVWVDGFGLKMFHTLHEVFSDMFAESIDRYIVSSELYYAFKIYC